MSCNGCTLNTDLDRPKMLGTYDWLNDLPDTAHLSKIVEVRFKGTRKEFFLNEDGIPLKRDDLVVVASSPGHDVGYVSLTGRLAELQFKRKIKNPHRYTLLKIYRKAGAGDTEKWEAAKKREKEVMIRARQLAAQLGLDMKIGDVEFRGDGVKAIFYYIADERVDFRELIKRYASEFRIKVEMKQIGVRQEAGRVGGFGSCGRELCCSTWRTDFSSITSEMALKQGLSPSAEKMAGRCGKLKCCLIYELDHYLEAQEDFPNELLDLETDKGLARHFKTDILQKKIWYIYPDQPAAGSFALDLEDVKKIINQNKRGEKPSLQNIGTPAVINKEPTLQVGSVNDEIIRRNEKRKIKNKRNKRKFRPGEPSKK
ncbi:MAG: regulatory iron-sulfur-containing complex subunit RicT [Prolixibacteraceae bacterium]|nr:regulatory iron-sulfur-containing complex subunit RicT [Prolixibacteraceae bacterium]